ncbi:MAG: glycosyltransferase family 1 protein [Candidatus Eisenbacteria bacterium]
MNIAYDLRYATDHFPGIGTHARALAAALLEREGVSSVTFLWNPRELNTRFDLRPLRDHVRSRWLEIDVPALAPGTAHGTGRVLSKLGVDAFLSPFWLRPEGTNLPCVLTLHDVLPLSLPSLSPWPRRFAFSWAMGRAAGAAAVITSSRFSRSEILRLTRIPVERLHVVPLGVAASSVPPVRPQGVPDGPFALVVAAHRPHKGLETLAAVWRDFARSAPLALVSAGPIAQGQSPLVQRPGADAATHALGRVTSAELEWLYGHATLVLVPSRYEGFGLPLLEAALRGAPVIASDIPPLRETGDGVARFVPLDDTAAWGRAIHELAADGAARASMRSSGITRAAGYNDARCAERVEEVLHFTLAEARA